MDVTALRALCEVARLGSISAAAHELGYSQSALSRQIAALEGRFGAELLERHARGVRVTPAGQVLVDHAAAVLQRLRRAERDVAASRIRPVARLQVGAVPTVSAGLLPRALTGFAAELPDVRVAFVEDVTPRLLPRLFDAELDVAVVTDYPPGLPAHEGLAFTHLLDDELVCLLPPGHRLAVGGTRETAVDLAGLADEIWVEDYAGAASVLSAACARAGFSPRIDIECGSWLGKQAFVAEGHGIALAPRLLVPSLRADLVVRPLADPPRRGVYLVRRTASDETALAAGVFMDALERAAGVGPGLAKKPSSV